MTRHKVDFLDDSGTQAIAQVADEGAYFAGTVDLSPVAPALRRLFDEFEEVVNQQVFSVLDEVQERISSQGIKASSRMAAKGSFTTSRCPPAPARSRSS